MGWTSPGVELLAGWYLTELGGCYSTGAKNESTKRFVPYQRLAAKGSGVIAHSPPGFHHSFPLVVKGYGSLVMDFIPNSVRNAHVVQVLPK